MTAPTPAEVAAVRGDNRRACALVAHMSRGDQEGCHAILVEAVQAGRYCELVYSIACLTLTLVPALLTEQGQASLTQTAALIEAGQW